MFIINKYMYIYVCIFTPRLSAPRSTLVAVEFVSDAIPPVPRVCTVVGILADRSPREFVEGT